MHVRFVVFDLVFQYLAKRLAGKNVYEMLNPSKSKSTANGTPYLIFRHRVPPERPSELPVRTASARPSETDPEATETNFAEHGRCLTKSATRRALVGARTSCVLEEWSISS